MLSKWIHWDDVVELWIKVNQRGLNFIFSKLNLKGTRRTISAFSGDFIHANWWIIPAIKERWNQKITKKRNVGYEEYVSTKYQLNTQDAKLVSLGCGEGNHEIKFAKLNSKLNVIGYDLSDELINKAKAKVRNEGIQNATFIAADVYPLQFDKESIDFFLFHASLHHFKNIPEFINSKILPALKKNGLIIVNEYVGPNRLQFSNEQLTTCNHILNNFINKECRKILNLNMYKSRCYKMGQMRMILSDPSECIDSESIVPTLRNNFKEIEFVKLGGNILAPVLKHIAHHFVKNYDHTIEILCQKEDEYLENHESDYIFGIYQKLL